MTHLMKNMKWYLFEVYFLIFRFELFFSQRPDRFFRKVLGGNKEIDDLVLSFEKAKRMSYIFPKEAENNFLNLLKVIDTLGHSRNELSNMEEEIWFLLAALSQEKEEQVFCLENVLRINPNHRQARIDCLTLKGETIFPLARKKFKK